MNEFNEQYFPSDFLTDYISLPAPLGKKRLLTYTIFRFFSFAAKENRNLVFQLREKLFPEKQDFQFSAIESYLDQDYYFSPSLEDNSEDVFFLYAAIYITDNTSDCCPPETFSGNAMPSLSALTDDLILSVCPALGSAPLTDDTFHFDALIQTNIDFYAALYLALTKYPASFASLLPAFTAVYRPDCHFTCEDFILFDFMDEYFEQKNCRLHPAFREMTDALVNAVLNYYKTDLNTLLYGEAAKPLTGSSSRFAALKRFGSVTLTDCGTKEHSIHMLHTLFRYAAVFELRNHLFDYHLEEDSLVTLENWKEKLHWHYVQYSAVYDLALSSYYAASLSRRLLALRFEQTVSLLTP